MAYAQQPNDMKAPPPYSSGGMENPAMAYPGQPQHYGEFEQVDDLAFEWPIFS